MLANHKEAPIIASRKNVQVALKFMARHRPDGSGLTKVANAAPANNEATRESTLRRFSESPPVAVETRLAAAIACRAPAAAPCHKAFEEHHEQANPPRPEAWGV